VLDPLGGGEQLGIHGRRTQHAADLPHRRAYGIEEGAAGILHQVPAVGDLGGVRQGLGRRQGIAAAAIASHDGDLLLARQPILCRRRLTIR